MSAAAHARDVRLAELLAELESLVVAFSGGVDSALLAVRAHQVLGVRALAVTADSPSLAGPQRAQALELARAFGFAHRIVRTSELDNPRYARNLADRCYHCKSELFAHLLPLAAGLGFRHVAYGLIADDLADFRPGRRAAAEAGVRSPLAEVGLRKHEVRELSHALGLATWDQPASPCLASRVAYGIAVTPGVLARVEQAERSVRALGFREFRVRHLGEAARIEIAPDELARLDAGLRAAVEAGVRAAGYGRVAIDPEGYRRGRLNEALPGLRA